MAKVKIYRKKPGIAFSGSVIQQNFGEDYYNHGYLKWNLSTKKFEFVRVPNDVVYYTFYINDDNFPTEFDLPKYPHIRLVLSNTSRIKAEEFLLTLKSKYEVKSTVITSLSDNNDYPGRTDISIIGDVNNLNYQNELIIDYLKKTQGLTDATIIETIKRLNHELNGELTVNDLVSIGRWKLKEMWFSNMFSYGEDNYINFESLNGVCGLYGKNRTGKSSIIDILLFALYDKSSRAFKAIDILNLDKDEFYVKLRFEMDGIEYYIEKQGIRKYDPNSNYLRARVTTNFWCIEDGEEKSLNGDQRRQSNNIIQSILGSYENMTLTSISLQNENLGIINKSQSERKMLLSSFLGIDIFEKLHFLANTEYKKIETLLSEYKKNDYSEELYKIEQELINDDNLSRSLKNSISELEFSIKNITDEIIDKNKQIEKLNIEKLNLQELQSEEEIHKKAILSIKQILTKTKEEVKRITKEGKDIQKTLSKYNIEQISNNIKELDKLVEDKKEMESTISIKNNDIEHQKLKLDKLSKLKYDPNCTYCMNNIFVIDAINTKKEYTTTLNILKTLQDELNTLQKKITDLSINETYQKHITSLQENLTTLRSNYVKGNLMVEKYTAQLGLQRANLKIITEQIRRYYRNKKNIEKNNIIEAEIKLLDEQVTELTTKLNKERKKHFDIITRIGINKNAKKKILENINTLKEYESRRIALMYYLEAVYRDGVPYDLIKSVVPILETEINNILSQMVNFRMNIILDDKNIELIFVDAAGRSYPIRTTSGMEKFISSIAIRVALSKIATIAKPNFIIIDEGMGYLDSENLNMIPDLFEYLKMYYDFIIIISHIDVVRDSSTQYLEIDSTREYSKIYIE